MGRKGKWFGFSSGSKDKKNKKSKKSRSLFCCSNFDEKSPEVLDSGSSKSGPGYVPARPRTAVVTAEPAEFSQEDEAAAIMIQTAIRTYTARQSLRSLRGLARLKVRNESKVVKNQAADAFRFMHSTARIQFQVRSTRARATEENQALYKNMQSKHQQDIEKKQLMTTDDWDTRIQSKEKIEASLQIKQDAAIRRERALAYAFSHQWKSSSRASATMFVNPKNPQWGWSKLERWVRTETDADVPKTYTRHVSLPKKVRPREDDVVSVRSSGRSSNMSSSGDPRYMMPTESTKAKTRMKIVTTDTSDTASDRGSVGSARKRMSVTSSPLRPRGRSGSPKRNEPAK